MAQQGDPGYKATAVLLGECGLALALDRDKLSDLRGVLTPAAAMGDALLDRFPAAGVTLETSASMIRPRQIACRPRSTATSVVQRLCNNPATKVDSHGRS